MNWEPWPVERLVGPLGVAEDAAGGAVGLEVFHPPGGEQGPHQWILFLRSVCGLKATTRFWVRIWRIAS